MIIEETEKIFKTLAKYNLILSGEKLDIFAGYLLFHLIRYDEVSYNWMIKDFYVDRNLLDEREKLERCLCYLKKCGILYEKKQPKRLITKTDKGKRLFSELSDIYKTKTIH